MFRNPTPRIHKEELQFFPSETRIKSGKKIVSNKATVLQKAFTSILCGLKCKQPHTIGKSLLLPVAIDMSGIMIAKQGQEWLSLPLLPNNTIYRCTNDLAENMQDQLTERVKKS